MPQQLRPLAAEFVGTLLFVFLGVGSVVASSGPLGVALAHGVGMAIIVSMTMSISGGHINPAVTMGLWIANRFDGRLVWQYIAAQLLGAIAGAALGKAVSSEAPKIGGFGIGLAIFVDILVGGSLTGAVMNPARAFGPALIAGQWDAHAVYWIGPLIGAGVAGALWKAVLLPRR